MILALAQIEEAAKLADHVARQEPGWQLTFVLFLGGAALAWFGRYWTKRHDKLSDRLDKVQDEQMDYLRETNARTLNVLEANTNAMGRFSDAIGAVQHLFRQH